MQFNRRYDPVGTWDRRPGQTARKDGLDRQAGQTARTEIQDRQPGQTE